MPETPRDDPQMPTSPTAPTPGVERPMDILIGVKKPGSPSATELIEAAMKLAAEHKAPGKPED